MRKPSLDSLIKKMVILTDNREQTPWRFPNQRNCTLKSGDYSVEYDGKSYEDIIIIERKSSVSEIFSATGSGRERWERELERLQGVYYRFVLCEFDYMSFLNDAPPGRLATSAVYGSIPSWHIQYNTPFVMCGNRVNARAYAYKIFYEFIKYKVLENKNDEPETV
jgi:hypothetical protein